MRDESAPGRPAVTVAIPTFNRRPFLEQAVASVLKQTLTDFELIIVDDGSTDGTGELVRSIEDPRVRYHGLGRNRGSVNAFNECARLARGKYTCIFGDDDLMYPTNLAEKIACLEARADIGMVCSAVQRIRRDSSSYDWYPLSTKEFSIMGRRNFWRMMMGWNPVCASSVVARTELYQRLRFDEGLPYSADVHMWLRIFLAQGIGFIPKTLVAYRLHDTNLGKACEKRAFGLGGTAQLRLAALKVLHAHGDDIQERARLRNRMDVRFTRLLLQPARLRFRTGKPVKALVLLVTAVLLCPGLFLLPRSGKARRNLRSHRTAA